MEAKIMTIKKIKILIPVISLMLIIFTYTISLAWNDGYTDRPAPQLKIVGEGGTQDIVDINDSYDSDISILEPYIENEEMSSGILVSPEDPPVIKK